MGIESILRWVVVSDQHCGCQYGLCPRDGVVLDGGGRYHPNHMQVAVNDYWDEFWDKWVPEVTDGEPFGVVINGDVIDGRHHGSTTQISQNIADQLKVAYEVMMPKLERAQYVYMVRGTPAHVGESGEWEEMIAERLGAIPDSDGRFSRNELWKKIGNGICHFAHHIGCASSTAYSTSALNRELSEMLAVAGRWGEEPPDIVCRSHRHQKDEIRLSTCRGEAICFTTAAWQLKTPVTFKWFGPRVSLPQLGGSIIIQGDHDLYVRHKVWTLKRPKCE